MPHVAESTHLVDVLKLFADRRVVLRCFNIFFCQVEYLLNTSNIQINILNLCLLFHLFEKHEFLFTKI